MSKGQCDCCGAYPVKRSFAIAYGIETWACAKCTGDDDDWDDEDEAAFERAEANRIARIEWNNHHPGEPCPDCELPFPRNEPDDDTANGGTS